jgi:5-azacytidine-induced protein 1
MDCVYAYVIPWPTIPKYTTTPRQDQDDAVERERAAAAARLREACERYEQQMQVQRLRLVGDAELKLEAAEAARREERRRGEEAAAAAADAFRAREAELREEHAR